MKIHFHIRYATAFGENLFVILLAEDGSAANEYALHYLNDEWWHGEIESGDTALSYYYELRDAAGRKKTEWGQRHIEAGADQLEVFDAWTPPGSLENAFVTKPFRDIFYKRGKGAKRSAPGQYTHAFRVQAPTLSADEVPCLLGHGRALRDWDVAAPLLMEPEGAWWTLRVDLSGENFPLAYKYGVWNTRDKRFLGFEEGGNRSLFGAAADGGRVLLHDGFARFPYQPWRGAGVAIPVFSLRSAKSWGVGEFADLHGLADWAQGVGLRLIQLLPINDTSATGAWTDSYPYAAISAFALHPIYLNPDKVAGKTHAALLKPYTALRKKLNALPAVDYEVVMHLKWKVIRDLYAAQKDAFLTDPDFIRYFAENRHWLVPYAAFCYLKNLHGTADFSQWPDHSVFVAEKIARLTAPKTPHFDEVAIHYFVQWQLHLQLREAADYAHRQGIAVKGDIPIGIYRHSCDAWTAPELYNMDLQAGAPPDDFAEKGQNWGFPTYNWERMKEDHFAWWKQRFRQMSLYFDAFRIDHILGFFRIWSIPLDAVEGILGYFVPALPVTEQALRAAGAGFDYERFCKPWINDRVLWEQFGEAAEEVRKQFLNVHLDGHYALKSGFGTQEGIEAWFADQPDTEANRQLKTGLFSLAANVILLDTGDGASADGWRGAFRFGMEKTSSFRQLDPAVREALHGLYLDYFYRSQDDFWQAKAMEKLPALKRSTDMLICGEDLGMVPHCVPDVMQELGLLSLEIQRMPKKTGQRFFHPKDAPYLSVVTPSTHDMSTLRGWWEEDRDLTQRFFNEVLGHHGKAPWYCEPWINRALLEQHLHSPAMWAIFQLQDLLGMDGALRRENPQEERINVPANPKHYWQYRMHLSLEELLKAEGFNLALRTMVSESGR